MPKVDRIASNENQHEKQHCSLNLIIHDRINCTLISDILDGFSDTQETYKKYVQTLLKNTYLDVCTSDAVNIICATM